MTIVEGGKFIAGIKDAPKYGEFLTWLAMRGKIDFHEKEMIEHHGKDNSEVNVGNYNTFAMENGISQVIA